MAHLERLCELSVESLYLALESFHVLEQVGIARNSEFLAEQIRQRSARSGITLGSKLTGKTLNKHIKKVEKALGGMSLFDRPESGPRGWKVFNDEAKHAKARLVFDYIENIVERFHQLESVTERFTVSIGCSRTLGSWFVPNVCQNVKDDLVDEARRAGKRLEFDVLFGHDMPQVVRNQGMGLGVFDIVVASCHVDDRPDRTIEGHVLLPMRLMLNRRDPLSIRDDVKWEDLNGYTLLLQPKVLNPQPIYPFDHFPPGLFYKRVDSYAEAFAAVRAAGSTGKIACLAFPNAHSPEQRSGLRAYELPELRSIPVGVIRPTKAIERTDEVRGKVVDAFTKAILRRLRMLETEANEDRFKTFFAKQPFKTFHVTRKPVDGKTHHWLRGELRNVAISSDGYFEADHVVFNKFRRDTPIEYTIVGHINLERGLYQLSWRGTKLKGDDVPAEDYSANLVFRDPSMPWLGCWLGKSLWDEGPDFGYFLVYHGSPVERLSADDNEGLGNVIDKYYLDNDDLPQLFLNVPGRDGMASSERPPATKMARRRAR